MPERPSATKSAPSASKRLRAKRASGAAFSKKRYGSEKPRLYTPPRRRLTPNTSLGYEAIEWAEEDLGITLLPWQKWFLIHSLELNEDGSLRFRRVYLLVSRQNGKSLVMAIRLLWRMFIEDTNVLATAHKLDAAEEVWNVALKLVRESALADDLEKVSNTNGLKQFTLKDGARWKVQASNDDAGRSLSIDDLFLDELRQMREYSPFAAMTGTMTARPNGQLLAASNAGEAKSVVLREEREACLRSIEAGDDSTVHGLFEWSAPEECDVDDLNGWYQANPSLGWTITEDTLRSQLSMPEAKFRTEHLCQWVTALVPTYYSQEEYAHTLDRESEISPSSPLVLSVDVTPDRSRSAISVAGFRSDGLVHVELVAARAGMLWVVPYTLAVAKAQGIDHVALQLRGARAGEFAPQLEEAGLTVLQINGNALGAAPGQLKDRFANRSVYHLDQPALELSLCNLMTRSLGEAQVFDRVNTAVDSSPGISAAQAVYGLLHYDVEPELVSAYATLEGEEEKEWWL